jgi:hypothetical protein
MSPLRYCRNTGDKAHQYIFISVGLLRRSYERSNDAQRRDDTLSDAHASRKLYPWRNRFKCAADIRWATLPFVHPDRPEEVFI